MEYIIIGIVLIVIGVVMVRAAQKDNKKITEIKYMQTTPIADAMELVDTMTGTDPGYRHYVEIKGVVKSDEKVRAPFSEKEVVYYSNQTFSVTQEEYTVEVNGKRERRRRNNEELISDEHSHVPVYVTDASTDAKLYVDMDSFGEDLELQQGANNFEEHREERFSLSGTKLLGYKRIEKILNVNQAVYILGEMYKDASGYHIGSATVGKSNQSKFTYKSEDQLIADTMSASKSKLILGGLMGIGGIIAIIYGFLS